MDELHNSCETLKDNFSESEGTIIISPHTMKKGTWLEITDGITIREDEWVSIGMSWSPKGKVDYLQGIRRPWWAVGRLYKWWYQRTIRNSFRNTS